MHWSTCFRLNQALNPSTRTRTFGGNKRNASDYWVWGQCSSSHDTDLVADVSLDPSTRLYLPSSARTRGCAPERLHSTFQGLAEGIHSGLGVGLGAMIGGVLYAGLGARKCFIVSAVLPASSFALLSLPVLQEHWQAIFKPTPALDGPLNNVGRYELFSEASVEGL